MKTKAKAFFGLAAAALLLGPAAGRMTTLPSGRSSASPQASSAATAAVRPRPSFISNAGQVDPRAAFYIPGRERSVFFESDGLTIVLDGASVPGYSGRWSVRLAFEGVGRGNRPVGEGRAPTVYSYFKGRPDEWRTGLAAFSRLAYRNLWPGVDLVYEAAADRLKYELVVRPGADPSKIRFAYSGVSSISVEPDGRLKITTPAGSFYDDAPAAFQEVDGRRSGVAAAFRVDEWSGREPSRTYGFALGDYDRRRPLVIDPAVLVYCGFIGGYYNDRGAAIARDADGNVFITGSTESPDFPVGVGPDLNYNSVYPGPDAFVAKVSSDGEDLLYCGFLGGNRGDEGAGIAVDAAGNAYIAGWTHSPDFPALVGPSLSYHGNITESSDGFVAKVNAAGTALVYSGYVGGSGVDRVLGLALDGSANAYIAGWTESTDFPRLTGPDLSANGGRDAFVAKVAATGAGFLYSGFIGGSAADEATGVAVDAAGRAYVSGVTSSRPSEGFPVAVGPRLSHSGGQDAFVARVSAAGTALEYCGYIGGSGDDSAEAIALDPSGSAYVAGATSSLNYFPAVKGPFLTHSGGVDAFVAKVKPGGDGLDYCGYIGGTGDDVAAAVAVDAAGVAYVAGETSSLSGFPVSGGPGLIHAGMTDAFVVTVKPSGEGLFYGGFIGGSAADGAAGVAADGRGNVWLTGYTWSSNFPVLVGPFLIPGGGYSLSSDAFAARISEELPPAAPSNLRSAGATTSAIDLAWDDESSNESGFEIERKSGAAGTWSRINTVGANVESYQDSGRPEATSYFYRVRAYNDMGESAYSNEPELATLPAAPTDLSAAAASARRVDLAWTDHSAGETGFRIERRAAPADPWLQAGTTGSNITIYRDRSVHEETTYDYRVVATGAGGDSAPTNVASVTTPALSIPAAPTNLQAAAVSPFSVDLSWTDNSDEEDGFRVERKTGADGTWAQAASVGLDVTAYTDTGLAENTVYVYRVKAYNGAGESAYSNEAGVTTPENRPRLRVPIADISYGNVNICVSSVQFTTLYNDGAAALAVTSVTKTAGGGEWSFYSPATPFSVPAGGSVAIGVRFAPTETGASAAGFAVGSNDPDTPSAPFGVSGTGFLPSISLSLAVQRLTERAWIIRRDYGRVQMTVTKAAPFNVTTYRLSRRTGSGPYQTVRDFVETDFAGGTLVYNDTFLEAGAAYTYELEALDCLGRLLASSAETGVPAPPPAQKAKSRLLRKRLP